MTHNKIRIEISLQRSLHVQITAFSDFKLMHLAKIVKCFVTHLVKKFFFPCLNTHVQINFQSKLKLWWVHVIKDVSQQLFTLTLNALLNPLAKKPPNGAINELKSERMME